MSKLPLVAAVLALHAASSWDARAEGERIVLGELTAGAGVDYAALETAAQAELGAIDATGVKRRVVVSLAGVRSGDAPVAFSIDALVRDRKTGAMLAVLSGKAQAEAGANAERRTAVLRAAVRCALSQVPQAAR